MTHPKTSGARPLPEKSPFFYRDGVLGAEAVTLNEIADAVGTPTWVYVAHAIDDAYAELARAMRSVSEEFLIAYAVKANANLAVLKRLAEAGCGADIVSGGELARCLQAGIPAERIVYSGVGKTRPEIRAALEAGIRAIHIESEPELHAVASVAAELGVVAPVTFRVNPDVDAETHPYIATGLHSTKFGLELDVARRLLPWAMDNEHVRLEGVACHIGSQLGTVEPMEEAVALLARFAVECRLAGADLRSIDVGGGWPVPYGDEHERFPTTDAFAEAISEGLREAGLEDVTIITEPGRSLVAHAGALLTEVIYEKQGAKKRFVICDGSMTELIRPSLYQAHHEVAPVVLGDAPWSDADVVGPVCESADFMARDRPLPPCPEGTRLAVLGAGAYGREMSSTYNARPLAAEVMISNGSWKLVRERAPVESLWERERS